jgi:hypothetical protein
MKKYFGSVPALVLAVVSCGAAVSCARPGAPILDNRR